MGIAAAACESLDYHRDLAYAEQRIPHLAAVDRDLAPFKKRGGKLVMYAVWMDPVVSPQDNVACYEAVVAGRALQGTGSIDEAANFACVTPGATAPRTSSSGGDQR